MAFDLDRNINTELSQFGKKLREDAAAKGLQVPQPAPSENTTVAPTSAPVIVETSTITPVAAQVAPTTPATEPVAPAAPVVTAPEPPSTDAPVIQEPAEEAWDKDVQIASAQKLDESDVPLTLEDLGSALKLESKLKNKAELVEQFTGLKNQIAELQATKEQSLEGLDPDLQEVVKLAKNKGNWKELLSTRVVNYSTAHPLDLLKSSMEADQRFKDPTTGLINFAAVDEEFAQIPTAVAMAAGNQIKSSLIQQQQLRRNAIIAEAEQKQTTFNRSLAEAAKKVPEVISREKFGITLEPKHSDFLYENIRNGKLIEKHLGKIDISGVDPAKLVATLAKAEWGEAAAKFQKKQGEIIGKKDLLRTVQNVQLNPGVVPPEPNQKVDKPVSAADKMAAVVNKYKTGPNSL